MKHKLLGLLIALASSLAFTATAQTAAIKTNVLDDAFANINLGAEFGLAPKWTLDVSGSFNAWNFSDNKMWKHWYLQPEARYWLCDRFDGHFFGVHAFAGQYNVGGIKHLTNFLGTDFGALKDYRFQGWFAGAGIAYGYAWALSRHINLEAEIGFGWAYTRYDKFERVGCGQRVDHRHPHNYVGPTKAALNFVYIF